MGNRWVNLALLVVGWAATALASVKGRYIEDYVGALTIFGGAMLTIGQWEKIVRRAPKKDA